jgi:tetratricopeptide (TPR) repeat protein
MLYLAPEYQPRFPALVQAVASGRSLVEACPDILGKSIEDVDADLHNYLARSKLQGILFSIKLTPSEEQPAVSTPDVFETDLLLADLLAVAQKREEARVAYEKLAGDYPNRPEIEQALGYLALASRDFAGARAHFENALKDGGGDAQMCYRLGTLPSVRGADLQVAAKALRRALELDPDYTEARLQLGIVLLQSNDYKASLDELTKIRKITPEMAPFYFNATAFDYLNLGDNAEAAKSTEMAIQYARTPEQAQQAKSLKVYLESRKN